MSKQHRGVIRKVITSDFFLGIDLTLINTSPDKPFLSSFIKSNLLVLGSRDTLQLSIIASIALGKVVILHPFYFCLYNCSCNYLTLPLACKDNILSAFLFYFVLFLFTIGLLYLVKWLTHCRN